MKRWQRNLMLLSGAGLVGTLASRYLLFRQKALPQTFMPRRIAQRGVRDLAVAHTPQTHGRLVILAHGFMDSMNRWPMAVLAEAMAERFDVLTFDFPGHGLSQGVCDLDFERCRDDLEQVIAYAQSQGHGHIGIVGYSMGAAAAILAAADGMPLEAVVSVCCPASPLPNGPRLASLPTALANPWMRLMGTRAAPQLHVKSWPIDHVAEVSPIPLLVVHHQYDYLVPRQTSESLFAVARPPKDYLHVPGAFHAHPTASQNQVIAWLDRTLSQGQTTSQDQASTRDETQEQEKEARDG